MAIKIRLSRGGSKKRPFYRVVASDSRMPRDGRFIEKLGTYNPLLTKDDPNRINLNIEKINDWLKKGAQVSDRISRILESLSILEPKKRNNPNKGKKHKATIEREASKAEKKLSDQTNVSTETDNNKSDGSKIDTDEKGIESLETTDTNNESLDKKQEELKDSKDADNQKNSQVNNNDNDSGNKNTNQEVEEEPSNNIQADESKSDNSESTKEVDTKTEEALENNSKKLSSGEKNDVSSKS